MRGVSWLCLKVFPQGILGCSVTHPFAHPAVLVHSNLRTRQVTPLPTAPLECRCTRLCVEVSSWKLERLKRCVAVDQAVDPSHPKSTEEVGWGQSKCPSCSEPLSLQQRGDPELSSVSSCSEMSFSRSLTPSLSVADDTVSSKKKKSQVLRAAAVHRALVITSPR